MERLKERIALAGQALQRQPSLPGLSKPALGGKEFACGGMLHQEGRGVIYG